MLKAETIILQMKKIYLECKEITVLLMKYLLLLK